MSTPSRLCPRRGDRLSGWRTDLRLIPPRLPSAAGVEALRLLCGTMAAEERRDLLWSLPLETRAVEHGMRLR